MRRSFLFVLLVGALAVRAHRLDAPWSLGDHTGWGGAFYSNIARNYLRYGLRETRFAPVVSTGTVPPSARVYYLTHPPGIGWLVAGSFRCFGVREGAARLVPIAFSLGSVLLVYRLGAGIASPAVGLVAALLMAFLPLEVLYGAHVDPQGPPVTFFALVLVDAVRTERPGRAVAALIAGALFDWPVHYLVALCGVHAALARRRRWVFALLAVSLAFAATFFVWSRSVVPEGERRYLHASPGDAFLFWTGLRVAPDHIPGYAVAAPSPRLWAARVRGYLATLVPWPLALLAAAGILLAARRPSARPWVWLLLAWGLLHPLLFPVGAYVHEYWWRYLGPGVCLAAALAVDAVAGAREARARRLRLVAAGLLLALVTAVDVGSFVDRWHRNRFVPPVLGLHLAQVLRPEEGVLSLLPFDVRDAYYADRPYRDGVNSVRRFREALADPFVRYRYFVVPEVLVRRRAAKPLFRLLARGAPPLRLEGLLLYDLSTLGEPGAPP